jgi:hypothetical protein
MNYKENNACQYVLHLIEILKYTPLVHMIQAFVISLPIALDEYPILCSLLVSQSVSFMVMVWIHLAGEELKKRQPDHVSEIEQERVKYLTLTHSRLTE